MKSLCALTSLAVAAVAASQSGCSTAQKKEQERAIRKIHRIVPYNVHARRPPSPGADPQAGPGGVDYRSTPPPDARLDCRPIRDLLSGLQTEALLTCLKSIPARTVVAYRLQRTAVPSLSLQPGETVPQCLFDVLPSIPVPREIFFQSTEEGALNCYSSRLDIEADEWLGTKVPKARWELKLEFPIPNLPEQLQSDEEREQMGLLLMSWALTPFWSQDPTGSVELRAVIVPDSLCVTCFGEKQLVRPVPAPPLWP